MPSRRAVLGAGAGLAGLVGLGGLASQVSIGDIDTWTPAPDTWPLARFSLANTAASPAASPPTEPTTAWTANPAIGGPDTHLVVGPDRVYASAAGTVALDRSSGEREWAWEAGGGPLALHDGVLYVAPDDDGPPRETPLAAIRARDGGVRWTTRAAVAREATAVLAADGTVFVGTEAGLGAFDAGSGRKRWASRSFLEPVPVVHGGRLHAAGDSTVRFQARTALGVALASPPGAAWETGTPGDAHYAAATASRLVVGVRREDGAEPSPGLVCLDHADGDIQWTADPATEGSSPIQVGPMAIAGDACVVGSRRAGVDRVENLSLTDGEERWRRRLDGRVHDLAVAGNTVLVATGADRVRGLRLADGRDVWGVRVFEATTLAPVDGTVFVGTGGGRVHALR